MVIFKEHLGIFDKISQLKVDSKIVLKHKDSNNQPMEIVIKKSDTRKGQYLLAVFTSFGKGWLCKESGYHSDIKRIEQYLLNKYFIRQKEVEFNC
ncbi:hypothetical protein D7X33_46355 [Butyricicoccus sp. 1XD8-22]|nr:hypothetical protein D7X33_46355 [Butyricicoccus sp. 1XD8-22]